jgi:hypothetical protein
VAAVDPADKATVLSAGLKASFEPLGAYATIAGLGLAVSGGIMLAGALAKPAAQAGTKRNIIATCALAAASAALLAESWPFHRELTAPPLPFSATGDLVELDQSIRRVQLHGPDAIERAPIVTLSQGKLAIEGAKCADAADLTSKLGELRKVDEMMHPGRPPCRRIIFSVDADTHGERLSTVLAACKAADFAQGIFAFMREGWLDRPLLGRVHVTGTSGARFEIDPGAQADERIPVGADESFSALAPRVVVARQRGHTVVLAY